MAIILKENRPAVDILGGTFERPAAPWSHLSEAPTRGRLEMAIAAVGRVDIIGSPSMSWLGTAFVVGPELLLASGLNLFLHKEGDRYIFNQGVSLVIDFGREKNQTQSYKAPVEEIVHFVQNWDIGLLRAKIPESVQPLILSTFGAEAYKGREAILIGYPAFDPRSDSVLIDTLFRREFDIKRLMPGRVLRVVDYRSGLASDGSKRRALEHDCTSLGGCSGAPLIDLETGHVLGIHFAGQFLKTNYAVPSTDLLAVPDFVQAGVRFAGTQLPSIAEEELSQNEMLLLETVIIPSRRPSLLARGWLSEVEALDLWCSKLKPYKDHLDAAQRGVGHLIVRNEKGEWVGAGTAFLVGERLALTTSFAVRKITEGTGNRVRLKSGVKAALDFSDSLGAPAGEKRAAIGGVKFIHPFFYLALLELEAAPEGATGLKLASQAPEQLGGREVVVLAYIDGEETDAPAEVVKILYEGRRGQLFLLPGLANQLGYLPGSPSVPALLNDCSTTIDASGGPLLDVATGHVIGVHTKSVYLEANYAQPTWEFSRDPHVWDFAIDFWPDPRPSWLKDWAASKLPDPLSPVEPQPVADKWTVEKAPIDWRLKEPRELEKHLVENIKLQYAVIFAQNVGFQISRINVNQEPVLFWRDLLTELSLAARLRLFVEEICSDQNYATIATKLRLYL